MPLASVIEEIQREASRLQTWSDFIWEHPELGLRERESSALLADELEAAGFDVQRGSGGLPTAFVASYGTGRPCIALLGEYDALPGLSQARGVAEPRPLVPGGPGHGCGHNLLGVGAAGAALAVREAMRRGEVRGSVRFIGCPAEETLVGKPFLVKAGVFDDVDCALTWHPGPFNAAAATGMLAINSARFTFHGVSSHAAAEPEYGRSALDAVELLNVGVNYLREHVPPTARLHYVITDGGLSPNIVPGRAEAWYFVRAPQRSEVEDIYGRVLEIARGASLMTGTTLEARFQGGCYDLLSNRTLSELVHANMLAIGAPVFDEGEKDLARRLRASLTPSPAPLPPWLNVPADPDMVLHEAVAPGLGYGEMEPVSTDVGDVSHVVPTTQLRTATAPVGTPGHSWQNVVAVGSSIGQKGMCFASKVLAATACDLLLHSELLAAAGKEFRAATAAELYTCPMRDLPVPSADL